MNHTYEKGKELRILFTLMVPILAEQILRSLIGTVNTFMLSRISDQASAAVGVANQIMTVIIIAATIIASGSAIVINQYLGAGKRREAAHIVMNSLTISGLIGLIMSIIVVSCSTGMIRLMGLDEELVEIAATYLRIVGISCMIQFVSSAISTYFRCYQKPAVALLVIIFTNILNLTGSLCVVNNVFNGFLEGVAGIATVRLFSEMCGLILIILILLKQDWGLRIKDMFRMEKEYVIQILRLGFMSGVEGICYNTAQLISTSFITGLPSVVLSAKVYVQTVNTYTYVAGQAVGMSAQIMTGHMIGADERDRAYKFVNKSWFLVLGFNVLFSLIFYLNAHHIIGIFTDSEEIIAIARTLFMIDIFTCIARSLNHTFNFGLRSAGFIFWPMIIAACSILSIQIGMAYMTSVHLGLGVIGIWLAQTTDEWIRGSCACVFWLKKKWMKINLVKD